MLKNKQLYLLIFTIIISFAIITAQQTHCKFSKNTLHKPSIVSANNFDGNRIDCDMENNGMFVSQNISGRSGLEWPKGNNTYIIFASGIWLGGVVNGDTLVSVGEYVGEYASGPWGADHNDPYHKIYKVSKRDLADPINNTDIQNWPVELGAPWVDENKNGTYEPLPYGYDHPEFLGDQILWMVMNDGLDSLHRVFNTAPLGVEVQRTIFGFDRPDAFGDMMFIKDLIINKGGNTIEDMYVGLWSDPDLGDAADDFVGCDTTLGMGICYNDGEDHDFANYSGGTPAVGYDYFQGPIVQAPGETAFAFGRDIPGYKNLQMTSFVGVLKQRVADIFYEPYNAKEAYNLLKGLNNNGTKIDDKYTGGSSYTLPGDPTKNIDNLDNEIVDQDFWSSHDRKILMNSGPFTMVPGDSQEVVFAVFMAANGDWDESYLKLKVVDVIAQNYYDYRFQTPPTPPKPQVSATALDDQIVLTWDNVAESYISENIIDKHPITGEPTFYAFEGYNVYQLETLTGAGEVKRIATYDIINGVREILDDVFVPEYGKHINIFVQHGKDSGLSHSIQIIQDALNNSNLKVNREYFFAVTAYGYNPYGIPKTLESMKEIIAVRPQVPNTWVANSDTVQYGYYFKAEHTAGTSDGSVNIEIIDPTKITGDAYKVSFNDYLLNGTDTLNVLNWDLANTTTGEIVLKNQVIVNGVNLITGDTLGYGASPVVDGLRVNVYGPQPGGVKQVYETDADDVELDPRVGVYPPSLGTTGYILSHREHANVGWAGHTHDRFGFWGMDDVIIDFSEQSLAFTYSGGATVNETVTGLPSMAPFSMYRVKFPTGEIIRLFTGWWEIDGDNVWSVPGVDTDWTDYGKPSYEPMYAWQGYDWDGNEVAYDPANDATHIADGGLPAGAAWGTSAGEFKYPFVTATMMVLYLDGSTPPWGNRIWIKTNKANTSADEFIFSTASLVGKTIEYNLSKIKVWPNPYFGYNPEEKNVDDRQIYFTHLPEEGKCIIRIFDLTGTLVRKLEHNNGTQYEIWDVRDYHTNPVSSGMYIVHIETEQGEKILKLAVIQPQF